MNEVTPGRFRKKTLFVNSGAEAIDDAVKSARVHTGRAGIIAFEDAFHGRTMMTLALTSKTHPYTAGFAPFPSDVYRIPYAYCYRCSYSLRYPSCDVFCASHLEDTFKRVVAAEEVAAVIAEPVLGEGGFVVPPKEFFRILIDICHNHGVLFIADEVQSGFGRTGKLFASEHYGIEPDIVVTAKSLGARADRVVSRVIFECNPRSGSARRDRCADGRGTRRARSRSEGRLREEGGSGADSVARTNEAQAHYHGVI